ncbi:Uncharacterised protein [Mycobacterium tuberculosis]|nr:Uncharacterised protein [Mycobacterium tuberculosis]
MTKIVSKTWNPTMVSITSTKNTTGLRRGRVMCQNDFHPLAPSISAASCTSAGCALSPARKISIEYPNPFQTETMAREARTSH